MLQNVARQDGPKNWSFRSSCLLSVSGLLSCAVGVRVATIVVSWCMLPDSCVSTKFISRMELVVEASIIEMGTPSCSCNVSALIVTRRERASTAQCLAPAIGTALKSNLVKRSCHRAKWLVLLDRLRIHMSESRSERTVNRFFSR